jgi:dihydropteroate synthase
MSGAAVAMRDAATIGASLACVSLGAHVLRVHDVFSVRSALTVYLKMLGQER